MLLPYIASSRMDGMLAGGLRTAKIRVIRKRSSVQSTGPTRTVTDSMATYGIASCVCGQHTGFVHPEEARCCRAVSKPALSLAEADLS